MDTDQRLDLTIRRLEGQAEAEACARMMSASEPWVTLQRGHEESLRLLVDPQREVYVAVEQGTLAGFIVLLMHGAFTGYIQTVCVAPEMRNRGVGGRLLDFAEERILCDSPNVFLCVSSFNRDARRLYQRRGYQTVGELTDFIVAGHHEILMRKTTGPLRGFRKGS